MTYGTLKLRLTQAYPGVSLDLIEGWCNDRYHEILAELPWTHQNIQTVLQTTAPYTLGTVAVTAGSNAIALTGGAWTAAMTGLFFRVQGQADYYRFTYTSPTAGTLDRPYDGATSTAAGYSLYQTVYLLPPDCRLLEDDAFCCSSLMQMIRFTHEQLNQSDPDRSMTGTPTSWALVMDDNSIPPRMQVELWPMPDAVYSCPFTYQSTGGELTSEQTILQVWMQPSALVEGITARIKIHLKDQVGATFALGLANSAMKTMLQAEANGMAPAQMQLSSYYTGYRTKKWTR